MTKIKSPFSWVGNKYKYLDLINSAVKNNEFDKVYDPFMGSGNIILNLEVTSNKLIGNDKVPLLPNIYNEIKKTKEDFNSEDAREILNDWDRFSKKINYYNFREHWNGKYVHNEIDKTFIYETALLLKMCSNSMVRFNTNGLFNQGFRGYYGNKKEFFSDYSINNIVKDLNLLKKRLQEKQFSFYSLDFRDMLSKLTEEDLVILDPPYILSPGMYGKNFTTEDDEYLIDFMRKTESKYIYFNYTESEEKRHESLLEFISDNKENLAIEKINNQTAIGQGRKNSKSISEYMISNIRNK